MSDVVPFPAPAGKQPEILPHANALARHALATIEATAEVFILIEEHLDPVVASAFVQIRARALAALADSAGTPGPGADQC
jgi:hypothetical protein